MKHLPVQLHSKIIKSHYAAIPITKENEAYDAYKAWGG